jgi:autotransporter-associated beta strand protein
VPKLNPVTASRRARVLAAAAAAAAAAAVVIGSPAAAPGATKTWTNAGIAHDSQWDTTANWSPSGEPTSSDDVVFPSTVPFASFFITLSSGEQARSLTLDNFYHLQSGSLTLATASVSVASGSNGFITGVVAGTAGLTLTGGGRLDLSGVNTFTGNVTVSGSTLAVDADSRLGNFPNSVTLNGGELITQASFTTSRVFTIGASGGTMQQVGGTTLTFGGALATNANPLTVHGAGTLALGSASFRTGTTAIQNGTVRLNNGGELGSGLITVSSSGTLELDGGLTGVPVSLLNTATLRGTSLATFGGSITPAPGASVTLTTTGSSDVLNPLNYNGGSGATTHVTGSGEVRLTNANTYAGDWQVDSGTLRVSAATALGSGTSPVVVNDSGTLDVAGVALDRAVNLNTGGTLKFEGVAQSNGVHTIASAAAVGFALKGLGASASLGNLANDLTGGNAASTITVSSDTAGNVLALNQSSDYAGNWSIGTFATLRITDATALGSGTSAVILAGGTLEIGGVTFGRNITETVTTSTLRGTGTAGASGTVTIPSGATMNIGTGASAADVLTLGNLSGGGTGSLIIVGGAGKTVLTQSSNYVGNWSVASGSTLEISADDQLGAAADTVTFGGVVSTTASFTSSRVWRTSDGTISTAPATTVIFNGLLGGGSGAGTFIKAGAGTLQLNASTTRTSASTINAGTVRLTGSVNGLGSGTASVNNTGTLELATASITAGGIRINDGGTLQGTGTSSYINSGFPQITNSPANVNITVAGAADVLTLGSAIRTVSASASSSTIHVNGAGRLILASGGTTGTDIFGGVWQQTSGIVQVGQSAGNSINGLGFKNGDAKQASTIAVGGSGTLAVGVLGSGANTPPWLRASVVLAGGKIASTNGIDAQYGGDFIVSSVTSRVLLFDPVAPPTARSVSLVAGAAGADNFDAVTIWGADSTLIVDSGATTAGAFNILRTGGTFSVGANATLLIDPGGTVNLGGTADALSDGVNHVNVVNNSIASFNVTAGSKNIGTLSGIGNTSVSAGATLTADHIRQTALTVGGSAIVRPDGSATGTSNVFTLTIPAGGKLDLNDNKLISASAVGSVSGVTYSGVTGLIQSGRNGGGWGGSGIVTSQTDATGGTFTSIGIATAAQAKGIAATATTTWGGQTVTGSDTLVMYTYGGDANLDGKLNVDDYGRIDSNIGLGTAGWFNGDFNYDGKVNVDDYGIIDSNIGIQGAPFPSGVGAAGPGGVTAVPEPALSPLSLALLLTSLSRRRRTRMAANESPLIDQSCGF